MSFSLHKPYRKHQTFAKHKPFVKYKLLNISTVLHIFVVIVGLDSSALCVERVEVRSMMMKCKLKKTQ